jgi:hypothetical protein
MDIKFNDLLASLFWRWGFGTLIAAEQRALGDVIRDSSLQMAPYDSFFTVL